MSRLEQLRDELEHEVRTTRKHLERVPPDRLDWRPHAKSFTLGGLGSHVVDCLRWVDPVFASDELEVDPAAYRPFEASSADALLEGLDVEAAKARSAMSASKDHDCVFPWRLKMGGKVWFEKPREAVFRDMTLSHLIHHRGQLSVYLRLLDVAVPGSYGPTADDKG